MSPEPITCACPQCGKQFHVRAELAGKRVVCKGCGSKFVVEPVKEPVAAGKVAGQPQQQSEAAADQPAADQPTPAASSEPPSSGPEDAPIAVDDSPIPVSAEADQSTAAPLISTRAQQTTEKVRIETKGPYLVAKLFLTGKMVHVTIEKTLNEYAEEGWRLKQVLPIGHEAYAIMVRQEEDTAE